MHQLKNCVSFILAIAVTQLAAQDRAPLTIEQQVKALIGGEYVGRRIEKLVPSCIYEGGGSLSTDTRTLDTWGYGNLYCEGKPVLVMEKFFGLVEDLPRTRIVDAVVIPAYEPNGSPGGPGTLQKTGTGPCTLDRKRDEFIMVLVREGRAKRNGEREDVAYGWRFDIRREKIIPVSTTRVRCVHDEP